MARKRVLNRPMVTVALLAALRAAWPAEPVKEPQDPDWPQFHGPRRDNLSADTGLLKEWPEGGPELVWQADGLGHGYATVAITGGIIYTAGNIDRDTVITAMDMSGKKLWQVKNGPAYRRSQPGARGTPTIAQGKLYHLNGDGDLICLDSKTGKTIWTLNILERFGGRNITWGLSESPLVDGDNVICCPGGTSVGMVALNKDTGETVWTSAGIGDRPGYASATIATCKGLRQILTMFAASAVGVAADTGRLLWRYEHKAPHGVNCVTPIHHDGHVAVFGTWGRGATLLKLDVEGDRCRVEEVWRTTELDNEHGGVVLVGGYLYGQADGDHKKRHWACLDWKTGKTMYSVDGLPGRSGTLTYADGMLYLLSEQGTVALAPATPEGLHIVSRFELPESGRGPAWAHPVVLGGRLYLRHGEYLYVHRVRRPAEPE